MRVSGRQITALLLSSRLRVSRPVDLETPALDDEQARRSRLLLRDEWSGL
jgi:hypothetical protein